MICSRCQAQNTDNINFCVNCGAPLGTFCPNCGMVNNPGTKFCANCGAAVGGTGKKQKKARQAAQVPTQVPFAPLPIPTVQYGTLPVQQGRSKWPVWLAVGIFLLLCGLIYWSMLIPVPLLPASTPGAAIIQRARIIQVNLPKPGAWQENEIEAIGRDQPQEVGIDEWGDMALPPACGPQVDLKVGNVSQANIWDQLGQFFGRGPLIYTIDNQGESMKGAEFGYHVEWVVIDEGERKVIRDNQWYACTGWDQDQLTCTGPDWRKYDSAQMCVYYEDPACQLPLQCFVFEGEDPFPAQDQQACQKNATFSVEKVDHINTIADWYIRTNDAQVFNGKYRLKTRTSNGLEAEGYCQVNVNDLLLCGGFDPGEFGAVEWEILREPVDICAEPLASGKTSGAAASQKCDQSEIFTLRSTSPGNTGEITWWIFEAKFPLDPRVFDADEYTLRTTNDAGEEMETPCQVVSGGKLGCEGWNPSRFQTVDWELKFKSGKDNCTELIASGTESEMGQSAQVCGQAATFEIDSHDTVNYNGMGMWRIKINDTNLYDGKYKLKTKTNTGMEMEGDCSVKVDEKAMYCTGFDPDQFESVEWEILQAPYDQCLDPVASGSTGGIAAQGSGEKRCDLFEGMGMKVVYLDWQPGAALTFYVKMPGGVPGLEKVIPGDPGPWNYRASIGDYETDVCSYQGYDERLYCSMNLPFEYSYAVRPLSLYVNDCNTPVYNDQTADLPGIEGASSGSSSGSSGSSGSGCSSGLGQSACQAAGGDWIYTTNSCYCPSGSSGSGSSCGSAPSGGCTSDYAAWCACIGGSYSCGFAGPVCGP